MYTRLIYALISNWLVGPFFFVAYVIGRMAIGKTKIPEGMIMLVLSPGMSREAVVCEIGEEKPDCWVFWQSLVWWLMMIFIIFTAITIL